MALEICCSLKLARKVWYSAAAHKSQGITRAGMMICKRAHSHSDDETYLIFHFSQQVYVLYVRGAKYLLKFKPGAGILSAIFGLKGDLSSNTLQRLQNWSFLWNKFCLTFKKCQYCCSEHSIYLESLIIRGRQRFEFSLSPKQHRHNSIVWIGTTGSKHVRPTYTQQTNAIMQQLSFFKASTCPQTSILLSVFVCDRCFCAR